MTNDHRIHHDQVVAADDIGIQREADRKRPCTLSAGAVPANPEPLTPHSPESRAPEEF